MLEWFRVNAPGIFSGDSDRLPTAELITTRYASLFDYSNIQSKSFRTWAELFTSVSPYDVWRSIQYESFLFAEHKSTEEALSHIVITLPTEGISEEAVKLYGGRDRGAFVAFVHGQLDGILVHFAVVALINSFRRNLMQTRDKLRVASPNKRRALHSLDYIQNFFSTSLQVPSIVGEIANATKAASSCRWCCDGFVRAESFRDDEPPAVLHERLCAHLNAIANRLLKDDKTTRDSFKQISEVVTARESVKAQRRMEILTVAAIVLAALSLWIALPPVKEWQAKLTNYMQQPLEATKSSHQVLPPAVKPPVLAPGDKETKQ